MMARRAMRRRAIVGTAATVSMVSSARRNRAERQAIEQQTDMNNQANQGYDEPAQAAPQDDLTAQLQQLDTLRKQGILTEEEFAAKKKQLLGI
jgi:hypothetical protein